MINATLIEKQLPWLGVVDLSVLMQDNSRKCVDDYPLSPTYGQVFIAKGSVWVLVSVRGMLKSTPSGGKSEKCFEFPEALRYRLKEYSRTDYSTVCFELAFTEQDYKDFTEGKLTC